MSKYYDKKEEIRQEAINWQLDFSNHNYSWGELADWCEHFICSP